jgi:hypothetical protein
MLVSYGYANVTNTPEYSEDFESFSPGFTLVGNSGWYSDDVEAAEIVSTNYSFGGSLPLPASAHSKVMKLDGTVTNKLTTPYVYNDGTNAYGEVTYYDFMLQATHWTDEAMPTVDIPRFAVFVDTNGYLNMYHQYFDGAASTTNGWTTLANTPIGSNEWIRITIEMYNRVDSDIGLQNFDFVSWGRNWFKLYLNGSALSHVRGVTNIAFDFDINTDDVSGDDLGTSGEFFASANNLATNSAFTASGTGYLDDLNVTTNSPFSGGTYWTITVSSGDNGSIAPGTESVADGSNSSVFAITADPYYHIDDVIADGISIGITNSYQFVAVDSNRTLNAQFAPDLASNGTPHWWMATYGITNNFDAAETNDGDMDGMTVAQEYLTGTDPTNPASVFAIMDIQRVNGTNQIMFLGGNTNMSPFLVYRATNLVNPNWTMIGSVPRNASSTNMFEDATTPNAFYRVAATN